MSLWTVACQAPLSMEFSRQEYLSGVAISFYRGSSQVPNPGIWIYILFIHSSVDGHLDCFYILVIMNNAAMNICVQGFVWIDVFIPLGYIPRSRIVGSYGNSMFYLLRNC